MNKAKMLSVVLLVALIFSSTANAKEIFRCFGYIINPGETTYSVLKKCGEPAYKETISSDGCDKVEKWHYDCYDRGYIDELIFKKGILANLDRGDNSKGTQKCRDEGKSF